MNKLYSIPFVPVYDNTVDAYVPEFWANESLAILEENMVVAQLVHRDFEPIVQQFGDVVNTRRPGEFIAVRKGPSDSVTIQDATATNIQVPLNQLIHVSFMIRDGEESESFKSLVDEFMFPAMLAQARMVDQILLGQMYQFLALNSTYGHLGGLSSSNAVQYITGVRNKMNINKAYVDGRNIILTPNSETQFLQNAQFTEAQKVGDDGTALREASLGRKLGFDVFMSQNQPSIAAGASTLAGAINHSAGYAIGATVLTVNGFTGAVTTGNWLTIAGDDRPQQITDHTETLGNTTSITITPGLASAVVTTAVVTTYTAGEVNLSAGYAAGTYTPIVYDTFTVDPVVGMMVTFNTAVNAYSILQVDTVGKTIVLDRPLDLAIANNDLINVGPPGDYNFAFHRNSVALVCRPLAQPREGIGARSAVINAGGLSMRATISYNGTMQGTLVTLDMLLGVAILDYNLGAVLFG